MDIVDNSSDFESKIRALISKVAWSIGIDIGDRLTTGARKLKFVVNGPLPSEGCFPEGFRDFEVYFQREFIRLGDQLSPFTLCLKIPTKSLIVPDRKNIEISIFEIQEFLKMSKFRYFKLAKFRNLKAHKWEKFDI